MSGVSGAPYILSVLMKTGLVQGQFGVWEIGGLYEDFTGMKSPNFYMVWYSLRTSQFISLQKSLAAFATVRAGREIHHPAGFDYKGRLPETVSSDNFPIKQILSFIP